MQQLTLARRFMLISLLVLVVGMSGIGWWVGRQIEAGVVQQTAAITALYVESFVAPILQDRGPGRPLAPERVAALSRLLQETPLGRQIVAFKIWDPSGQVLYSAEPSAIGQVFPVQGGLATALGGQVVSHISELEAEENVVERGQWPRLLETYSPIRRAGADEIIAVAEFYQTVDQLEREIGAATARSWLVVGLATAAMYLLLAGTVQQGSNTIERQRRALGEQVARLTRLLEQNAQLHQRVRRAAGRTAALNERFLRRIGAELHDGPAQYLGLALLRLDNEVARAETTERAGSDGRDLEELRVIEGSLRSALQEVRTISAGLAVPDLDRLSLAAILTRVARDHERRTGTRVALDLADLPEQALMPVKITLYRVAQEALHNAYRHAGGVGQEVRARGEREGVRLALSDRGPGLNGARDDEQEAHLGLVGMRERVESLGGDFRIETTPGVGTTILAHVPLHAADGDR